MLNAISMVTRKKIVIKYTQLQVRKEFKLFTREKRKQKSVMQKTRGQETMSYRRQIGK